MRSRIKAIAYIVSLIVFATAAWGPAPLLAQAFPGGGPTGGGGGISFPVLDTIFKVCDDGDSTKCVMVQASGITTATTRTLTLPNQSGTQTLIVTGAAGVAQTVAGSMIVSPAGNDQGIWFGAYNAANNSMIQSTINTPDTTVLGTGTLSNAYNITESGDQTSDFNNGSCGTAACTHPQVNFYPTALSTTQYNSQAYWGNAGRATKTLTESAATSAFQVSIASGAGTGGTADFTAFAADATDQQTLSGTIQFSGVNKAGTETCATPTAEGTPLNSVSAGTLTCTFTADTTPTNACNIQFNCVSSLTQTTLELYYRVNLVGPGQVTPQ